MKLKLASIATLSAAATSSALQNVPSGGRQLGPDGDSSIELCHGPCELQQVRVLLDAYHLMQNSVDVLKQNLQERCGGVLSDEFSRADDDQLDWYVSEAQTNGYWMMNVNDQPFSADREFRDCVSNQTALVVASAPEMASIWPARRSLQAQGMHTAALNDFMLPESQTFCRDICGRIPTEEYSVVGSNISAIMQSVQSSCGAVIHSGSQESTFWRLESYADGLEFSRGAKTFFDWASNTAAKNFVDCVLQYLPGDSGTGSPSSVPSAFPTGWPTFESTVQVTERATEEDTFESTWPTSVPTLENISEDSPYPTRAPSAAPTVVETEIGNRQQSSSEEGQTIKILITTAYSVAAAVGACAAFCGIRYIVRLFGQHGEINDVPVPSGDIEAN